MKVIRKIFVVLSILIVIGFLGVEVFVILKGEQTASRLLSRSFQRNVKVEDVYWLFPFEIILNRVDVDGVLYAKQVKVFFNYKSFKKDRIEIDRVVIKGGTVNVDLNKIKFSLKDLEGVVKKLVYPLESGQTNISFKAHIEGEKFLFAGNNVVVSGWTDLKNLDMKERVSVINSLGKEVLTVDLSSKQNDMLVEGKVDMIELLMQKANSQRDNARVQDLAFNALGIKGLNNKANFSFKTKMNDFHLEKISLSGKLAVVH